MGLWGVLGALLFTFGCGSVQEHRARHQQAAFAALSPGVQARLLEGHVQVGDTPQGVYIALGTPQYTLVNAEEQWVWVYWGTRGTPAAPGPPHPDADAVPAFHTRAELRLPRPSERREALCLAFEDGQLDAWSLREIDMQDARAAKPLPLGTLPARP